MKIVYKNKTSEEQILPYVPINYQDTIDIIKQKIILSEQVLQKPASINEIYLYTYSKSNISTLKILQTLSNNFTIPITYKILKNFCLSCWLQASTDHFKNGMSNCNP